MDKEKTEDKLTDKEAQEKTDKKKKFTGREETRGDILQHLYHQGLDLFKGRSYMLHNRDL